MRRGVVYALVAGLAAAAVGLVVLVIVASTGPVDLGPKVVVPSAPTEPPSRSGEDEGASPVPKPSPSQAGDDDDDDDDDADDDADDDGDD